MGIFNSFGAMSGQFAAKQERAKVAASLLEELQTAGRIGELVKSVKANGLEKLLTEWTTGNTAPASAVQVQQSLKGNPLLDALVRKTNMPIGVVKTSLTVLLPLAVRQLALDGQVSPDGKATGWPLTDANGLAEALA